MVELKPSPQSMLNVCVSKMPGSEKLPVRVVRPFSLVAGGGGLNTTLDGGTSVTVTFSVADTLVVAPLEVAVDVAVTVREKASLPGLRRVRPFKSLADRVHVPSAFLTPADRVSAAGT